jgi:hypothetical protein
MKNFYRSLRRNKNHKNLDIQRFLKQNFPTNIMRFLSKNANFANFNQLPKINDNLDRPKSFCFVFRSQLKNIWRPPFFDVAHYKKIACEKSPKLRYFLKKKLIVLDHFELFDYFFDQKRIILEKNVNWDFFLELIVEWKKISKLTWNDLLTPIVPTERSL